MGDGHPKSPDFTTMQSMHVKNYTCTPWIYTSKNKQIKNPPNQNLIISASIPLFQHNYECRSAETTQFGDNQVFNVPVL